MSDNDMIRNALAKYAQFHEAAQQVQANQSEYCELYSWLIGTRKLFPEAFEGQSEPAMPMQAPAVLPLIGLGLGASGTPSLLTGLQVPEVGLSARRKLNAEALDKVEEILRASGKPELPLAEIVLKMVEQGWSGYPLEDNAVALYNALMAKARSQERFKNLGDNTWALLP